MPRQSKRLLPFGLTLGIVALTAVLIACFAGPQEGNAPVEPRQQAGTALPSVQEVPNLLETSNRTELSLCVDGAGGFTPAQAQVQLVRQALDGAVAVVPSLPTEYGQRAVSAGCPPPTAMIGRPVPEDEPWTGVVRVGAGAPRDPSLHRLFVYFVSPDAYALHFGAKPYFRTIAEEMCQVDECWGVTGALYVSPSITADTLREALIDNLNLRPLLEQQ